MKALRIIFIATIIGQCAGHCYADNNSDAHAAIASSLLQDARGLLPPGFDSLDAAAKKAAIDEMSAADRAKLIKQLKLAYENANSHTFGIGMEGFIPAGQALFLLQDVDPSTRLDCLRRLQGLVQRLYSRDPLKNIGVGKQLAETHWAIAKELWTRLSADPQTKTLGINQMKAKLHEIGKEYNLAADLANDVLLNVAPYASGNRRLEDFVKGLDQLKHEIAADRKPIDGAIIALNRPGSWHPAAPVVAKQPDAIAAQPKPPKTAETQQPQTPAPPVAQTPAEPQPPTEPTTPPEQTASASGDESSASAAVPPPPPENTQAHDIFDFGRDGQ